MEWEEKMDVKMVEKWFDCRTEHYTRLRQKYNGSDNDSRNLKVEPESASALGEC